MQGRRANTIADAHYSQETIYQVEETSNADCHCCAAIFEMPRIMVFLALHGILYEDQHDREDEHGGKPGTAR